MSKDEIVDRLNENGFDAYLDESVIMFRIEKALTKKERKNMKNALTKLRYASSWGWKMFSPEKIGESE